MEIKVDTDDVLILEDPGRKVAGWAVIAIGVLWLLFIFPAAMRDNGLIVGSIALAGGGLIVGWGVLILRRSRVVFDARQRRVDVYRSQFGGVDWAVPFQELEELYLLRSQSDEGGPPGFLLIVGTARGDVQLSLAVVGEEVAVPARDAMARFLARNDLDIAVPPKPKGILARVNRPLDRAS